jgi:hypothetical protein
MMSQNDEPSQPHAVSESFAETRKLSEILLESVTALAGAGDVEAACRFAGRAYVVLRATDPAVARRFDVLLHRLTPMLTWQGHRDVCTVFKAGNCAALACYLYNETGGHANCDHHQFFIIGLMVDASFYS